MVDDIRKGITSKSLEDSLRERPVDRDAVDAHTKRLLDAVRAYRLRESREASNLT